jgi:hypothetical protein
VQKLSFNSSTKSAGSDSGRSSLTSPLSSRPILFGTSKTAISSPVSKTPSTKRSYKVLEENNEDSDSTPESPSIKQRKYISDSSDVIPPPDPPSSILSLPSNSQTQDRSDNIDLRHNSKTNVGMAPRTSRKSKPSQKIIENTLPD